MFPNLEFQQHRMGFTNADIARILRISSTTYKDKKRRGNFTKSQLIALCDLFCCHFEYLFFLSPASPKE